ncbi:uncharacterized protein LOC122944084 isoform X3 [Bufo gargarizans]|uniref:uncharacterized protein LOC122944084 isoform X3 n=1 Tax=Bufo gargarizans TaxID=30331 RepID=UPI001CF24005|nr:uncharacterized protein LOC122944084 isoform X3 [Bufo gargarizans]
MMKEPTENSPAARRMMTRKYLLSHVLQNKVSEMLRMTKPLLSHGFAKPAAQVAPMRPLIQKKEEKNASPNTNEKKDLEEKDINEDTSASEKVGKFDKNQGKSQRRSWGIKKDDEFFHFIIVCFALGAVLVCEYYYSDWTVSAGFGLLSFATLETIGIYFGLVYRIRTVVEQFLPLVGRFTLGSKKTG